MTKITSKIDADSLDKIRREWVKEKHKWYFSVVDVIELVTDSSDPRNYWKVTKNRLKNTQNKLVTACNQLKMTAKDGKAYLTDTLDSDKTLELIKLISPSNLNTFSLWFDALEKETRLSYPHHKIEIGENESKNEPEKELPVDAYETPDAIIVEALVAGVSIENIFISTTCKVLTIKGNRIKPKSFPEKNHAYQELHWGKFSRSIILPKEIEINKVEAKKSGGILKIRLPKIDKFFRKVIEVKESRES